MIIGVGTDIVEINRMKTSLEKFGDRFSKRILTTAEQACFAKHANQAAFLAKRFAAKEAAAKALGTGFSNGVSWQHIEVMNDELGAPKLHLFEHALEIQKKKGGRSLHLSLSDERLYAVAFVVMED